MTPSNGSSHLARLIRLITKPPQAPFRQLTLYFALLVILGAVLIRFVPGIGDVLTGAPLSDGGSGGGLRDLLADPLPTHGDYLAFDQRMLVVMLGTLLITIPTSWGYMAIREQSGYEQSVVQTLVILPVVVSGIMLVIQNSLALAFALGGVAAAVRFRNTLKDVSDATYVFLAIGLGIAAGSGALSGALVMSMLFTYVSVGLWRCNFGQCALEARAEAEAAAAAEQAARKSFRGEMAIDVNHDDARTLIETVLQSSTKRWKFRRTSTTPAGGTRLHYQVRLRRSGSVEALTEDFRQHAASGVGSPEFTEQMATAE